MVEPAGMLVAKAVAGQEPGEGEPFGVGEGRLNGDEGGGGHRVPPGRAETREGWASSEPQQLSGSPPYAPPPGYARSRPTGTNSSLCLPQSARSLPNRRCKLRCLHCKPRSTDPTILSDPC